MKTSKEQSTIIKNIDATLKFEGMLISETAKDLNNKMLQGQISGKEARNEILKKYNLVNL